jgi:hypothetical protein
VKAENLPSSRVNNRPRSRLSGCLKALGLIIILIIILPYVAKFGYCRGWWLKPTPWAYYWWLCDCGPDFEQSLYPDNIEIVVSACSDPKAATLSPDGRYMIIGVRLAAKSYLLDFVTGEKRGWLYRSPSPTDVEFWTDRFVQVVDSNQKRILLLDVTDESVINLITFDTTQKGNQLIIPSEAIQVFEKADNVVVREGLTDVVLALDSDPKQNPGKNYALFYPEDSQKQLEALLSANGIDYQILKLCSWAESSCTSHNGRLVATNKAIFSAEGQLLTQVQGNPSFNWGIMLIGWAHDDSGVYLRFNPASYIIDGGGFVFPNLSSASAYHQVEGPEGISFAGANIEIVSGRVSRFCQRSRIIEGKI